MDKCDSCGVDTKEYFRLRSYDWDRLAKVRAPLWKVVPCSKHDRTYTDIIAIQLPMSEIHKEHFKCGCMMTWNTYSEDYVKDGRWA